MLEIRDLHVQFHEADHEAVRGIDLTVGDGEIVGLVGESGSGKTVTAMMISGLLRPEQAAFRGQILLDGRDLLTSSGDTLANKQTHRLYEVLQAHGVQAEIKDYAKAEYDQSLPHVFSVLQPFEPAGTAAIDKALAFYKQAMTAKAAQ